MRRSLLIPVLALAAAFLLPGGASACGCGEFKGAVVAHGSSSYGVPWRIKAARSPASSGRPRYLEVNFSIGDPDKGIGYFSSLPIPVPRTFFTASPGSDVDEYPESDLSGVTGSRVAELKVKMNDGTVLTVTPTRAPAPLRQRLPWLRQARFFDAFFQAEQEPERVTAFDRDGKRLGSR